MRTRIFSFLFLALVSSGCNTTDSATQVLLVGDSWGQFMCAFKSFDGAFTRTGHSGVKTSCEATTLVGSTAEQWASKGNLDKVQAALLAAKNAKFVVLSLGGNDLTGNWALSQSDAEHQALFKQVAANITTVISAVLQIRADAKILITSYDYPNFDRLVDSPATKDYVKIFDRMGRPNPAQLNAALIGLEEEKLSLTRANSAVYYVSNLGLTQYYYGQSDHGIGSKALPHPGTAPNYSPFAGGDPSLPGAPESFLQLLPNVRDPYHVSQDSFALIADNLVAQYLGSWVK